MSAQNSPRKGYELELEARIITGATCLAELATRREEQCFCQQEERLGRALDRAQAMTPKLLKMLGIAYCSSSDEERDGKASRPTSARSGRNPAKTRHTQSRSCLDKLSGINKIASEAGAPKADKSFRINTSQSPWGIR